ncbi:MAG TPA: hypothetical protein VEK84_03755, partial [Terriglobales bacterium]|nr:hypothetical protein [Terriglobales bacterium]
MAGNENKILVAAPITATNAEIVQACLDAFGRGDTDTILNACAENVDVIFTGDQSIIPYAGQW